MPEKGYTVQILDHGYITLLDWIGTDAYLAETARVSTQSENKSTKLVASLIRDRHTSPIEFGIIQFEVKCPVLVIWDWIRHRTQSYSGLSSRYGEMPEELYNFPTGRLVRQHASNRQMGSNEILDDAGIVYDILAEHNKNAKSFVSKLLSLGLVREVAQRFLPMTQYTKFRMSGNLWNWMHFLELRCKEDTQWEVRLYAWEIQRILKELFPVAMEAWEEYIFYAQTFSRTEMLLLQKHFMLNALALAPDDVALLQPLQTLENKIKRYSDQYV